MRGNALKVRVFHELPSCLHSVEIWSYAALYHWVGAIRSFEDALYFSTATYATIGYGDLTLSKSWRVLGAIEGANGVILLGWSTAFFISIVARIRALEHDWSGVPVQQMRGSGSSSSSSSERWPPNAVSNTTWEEPTLKSPISAALGATVLSAANAASAVSGATTATSRPSQARYRGSKPSSSHTD